jgi:hypothetical protein
MLSAQISNNQTQHGCEWLHVPALEGRSKTAFAVLCAYISNGTRHHKCGAAKTKTRNAQRLNSMCSKAFVAEPPPLRNLTDIRLRRIGICRTDLKVTILPETKPDTPRINTYGIFLGKNTPRMIVRIAVRV